MSILIRAKTSRQAREAQASCIFGKYEEAARIYARIAKLCWSGCLYDDATTAIINASNCLVKADMADDAFDGIRCASIMLVQNGQVNPALRLGEQVYFLEVTYPDLFKNSHTPFKCFIYNLCRNKHLLE